MAEDVDMVSANLNALEIGLVLLLERNASCAAVTVFVLLGAMSCKSFLDLSARKVKGKLREV